MNYRIFTEKNSVELSYFKRVRSPLPEFVTHEELKSDSTNFESVCDMGIIVK